MLYYTHVCQLQHGEFSWVAHIEWTNLITVHDGDHATYQVIDVLEGAGLQWQAIKGSIQHTKVSLGHCLQPHVLYWTDAATTVARHK